jgi:hypothetical protein
MLSHERTFVYRSVDTRAQFACLVVRSAWLRCVVEISATCRGLRAGTPRRASFRRPRSGTAVYRFRLSKSAAAIGLVRRANRTTPLAWLLEYSSTLGANAENSKGSLTVMLISSTSPVPKILIASSASSTNGGSGTTRISTMDKTSAPKAAVIALGFTSGSPFAKVRSRLRRPQRRRDRRSSRRRSWPNPKLHKRWPRTDASFGLAASGRSKRLPHSRRSTGSKPWA